MRQGFRLWSREKTKIGIVDVQIKQRPASACRARRQRAELRFRMVQHVLRIHTNLQALGFRDLDRFTQTRIEAPSAWCFNRALSESASCSGQRILEKNLAGLRVRYSAERTESPQALRDSRAL